MKKKRNHFEFLGKILPQKRGSKKANFEFLIWLLDSLYGEDSFSIDKKKHLIKSKLLVLGDMPDGKKLSVSSVDGIDRLFNQLYKELASYDTHALQNIVFLILYVVMGPKPPGLFSNSKNKTTTYWKGEELELYNQFWSKLQKSQKQVKGLYLATEELERRLSIKTNRKRHSVSWVPLRFFQHQSKLLELISDLELMGKRRGVVFSEFKTRQRVNELKKAIDVHRNTQNINRLLDAIYATLSSFGFAAQVEKAEVWKLLNKGLGVKR